MRGRYANDLKLPPLTRIIWFVNTWIHTRPLFAHRNVRLRNANLESGVRASQLLLDAQCTRSVTAHAMPLSFCCDRGYPTTPGVSTMLSTF